MKNELVYACWFGGALFSQSAEEKYLWGMFLGFIAPIAVAWLDSRIKE